MRKLRLKKKETVTTLDDEILAQVYGGAVILDEGTADTSGC